jgi:hypothetical protein
MKKNTEMHHPQRAGYFVRRGGDKAYFPRQTALFYLPPHLSLIEDSALFIFCIPPYQEGFEPMNLVREPKCDNKWPQSPAQYDEKCLLKLKWQQVLSALFQQRAYFCTFFFTHFSAFLLVFFTWPASAFPLYSSSSSPSSSTSSYSPSFSPPPLLLLILKPRALPKCCLRASIFVVVFFYIHPTQFLGGVSSFVEVLFVQGTPPFEP